MKLTKNTGSEDKVNDIDHLNRIILKLIGDYMHPLCFKTRKEENEYIAQRNLTRVANTTGDKEKNDYRLSNDDDPVITETDIAMRDLFLWAVLINYIDMAKVFLAHMKYRICPALIATKILKEYNHIALHDKLKENYMESAKYFEQYAIECITACEERDTEQACKLVLQRNELYGFISCLQVNSVL